MSWRMIFEIGWKMERWRRINAQRRYSLLQRPMSFVESGQCPEVYALCARSNALTCPTA